MVGSESCLHSIDKKVGEEGALGQECATTVSGTRKDSTGGGVGEMEM